MNMPRPTPPSVEQQHEELLGCITLAECYAMAKHFSFNLNPAISSAIQRILGPPTCPPSTQPPLYLRCVPPPLMRPGPACTLPKLRGRKKSGTAVAGHLAQSFFLIARQPTAAPRPSAHRDAAPPTHTRHRTAAGGGCPPCAHPISLCSDDGLSQSGHIQVCRNRGEPLRTCPDHRDTPVESNSR